MASKEHDHKKPQIVPVVDIASLMASASAADLAHALRDPNDALHGTLEAMRAAATDWGVFYVTNHGISRDELARVHSTMRALFALPHHTKHRVRQRVDNSRGYTADDHSSDRADRSERFVVAGPHEDTTPHTRRGARVFANDQNQWLPDDELPDFQRTITSHFAHLQHVARRILKLLAVALGEHLEFFDAAFHGECSASDVVAPPSQMIPSSLAPHDATVRDGNSSTLELIHCPAVRDPEWTLRVCESTDNSALMLWLQDDTGDVIDRDSNSNSSDSLQVFHRSSQTWCALPPQRNALVVTVGDLLQLWSNDVFIAPLHRNVARDATTSQHTAMFRYCPLYDVVAQPIVVTTSCRSDGSVCAGAATVAVAKYRPLHWLTYLIAQIDGSFTNTVDDAHIRGYRIFQNST